MVVRGVAGDDVGGGFGGVVMRWWSVGCGDEVMASAEDGNGRFGGSVVVVIVGEVWCSVVRSGVGGVMMAYGVCRGVKVAGAWPDGTGDWPKKERRRRVVARVNIQMNEP
ncbi:hypothetical protein Tco_1250302 [Tanacetum coccineum]